MSHIDTFKHELVGLVAGVNLYHPLEKISGAYDADETKLLLGGGLGEFPQAILEPSHCVASYFMYLSDELFGGRYDHSVGYFLQTLRDALGDSVSVDDAIAAELLCGDIVDDLGGVNTGCFYGNFDAWSGDTWAWFVNAAKHPGCHTDAYEPERHGTIEHWINYVVGEFVLLSMPELIADTVAQERQPLLDAVREIVAHTHPMCGVMTYPTGYEHVAGRWKQLGDGNVRH